MSRTRRIVGLTSTVALLLVIGLPLAGRQAASPVGTLTLTIKGSTPYARPAPAPVHAALLVVTPVWEDTKAVTEVGSKEASGQPLFLSELAVALSGHAIDCTTVFTSAAPTGDQDFLIVAGKAEAYLPAKGWQTTVVGKVFTTESTNSQLAVDRFSVDVHSAAPRKKFSKDGVRGADGRLVLVQEAGNWKADFALKSGDVTAEGTLPLTFCPIASRKKPAMPLLTENRLIAAARAF